MSTENVKAKDLTSFEGPIDTGDPHGKRAADKRKVGDIQPDESVSKSAKKGTELPGTTNVGEEIEALFSDVEGLSEGFIEKASTIFEGAISEKVALIREELEEEYSTKLDEAVREISEDLENQLDGYLNLFVEEYMKKNEVAIERGIRNELAEEVIKAVTTIVEASGVELPEDKIDIAEALIEENKEFETKYNESLNENIELKKEIRKYQIAEAFQKGTEGLTEASKDKLRRLTENMEFTSVDQFNEKLNVLKESFTDAKPIADTSKTNLTEVSTVPEAPASNISPKMAGYIKAARGNLLNI